MAKIPFDGKKEYGFFLFLTSVKPNVLNFQIKEKMNPFFGDEFKGNCFKTYAEIKHIQILNISRSI